MADEEIETTEDEVPVVEAEETVVDPETIEDPEELTKEELEAQPESNIPEIPGQTFEQTRQIMMLQAGLRLIGYDVGDTLSGQIDEPTTALINKFIADNELETDPADLDTLINQIADKSQDPAALQRMAEIAAQGADATVTDTMTLQIGLIFNDIKSAFNGDYDAISDTEIGQFIKQLMEIFGLGEPSEGQDAPNANAADPNASEPIVPAQPLAQNPPPEVIAEAYLYYLEENGVEMTDEQAQELKQMVYTYESIPIDRETATAAVIANREFEGRDLEDLDSDVQYLNQQITLHRAEGLSEQDATLRSMQDLQTHMDERHDVVGSAPSSTEMMETYIRNYAFNVEQGPLTDEQRETMAELNYRGNAPSERVTVLDLASKDITAGADNKGGVAYSGLDRTRVIRLAREEMEPLRNGAPVTPIEDYVRNPAEEAQAREEYTARTGFVMADKIEVDPALIEEPIEEPEEETELDETLEEDEDVTLGPDTNEPETGELTDKQLAELEARQFHEDFLQDAEYLQMERQIVRGRYPTGFPQRDYDDPRYEEPYDPRDRRDDFEPEVQEEVLEEEVLEEEINPAEVLEEETLEEEIVPEEDTLEEPVDDIIEEPAQEYEPVEYNGPTMYAGPDPFEPLPSDGITSNIALASNEWPSALAAEGVSLETLKREQDAEISVQSDGQAYKNTGLGLA